MKKILLLIIFLCLFISGCQSYDKMMIGNNDTSIWCSAQSNSVFINGYLVNVTNFELNITIYDCCCTGKDEFVCICSNENNEVSTLFN